jgi:hypothetical protein
LATACSQIAHARLFLFISAFSFQHFSFYRHDLPIDIILNEAPVPIRDRMPGLGKELATVIDKALARNPKNRFLDAGKLLASIPKPRS